MCLIFLMFFSLIIKNNKTKNNLPRDFEDTYKNLTELKNSFMFLFYFIILSFA